MQKIRRYFIAPLRTVIIQVNTVIILLKSQHVYRMSQGIRPGDICFYLLCEKLKFKRHYYKKLFKNQTVTPKKFQDKKKA